MRRLILITLIIAAFLLAFPLAGLAQQEDPAPITSEQLDELVDRVEFAAERADNAVDLALGLFGLFEAMTGVVGLVLPILAVVAGLLGFRRLESAQRELREARERFERDMQEREAELDLLRDELKLSVQRQREDGARASLALALLPLGERQYRAQDYEGALDTYHRALELDPENPIIHYHIGYVHTQSGHLEKAEEHLSQSLERDPNFPPSLAALGYVFRRLGDKMEPGMERDIIYNKAEENFLRALHMSPKLMDEDKESWWGSLGGLYRRRGQVEQAIYAYEQCAKVTPHSSYPFSNLALLYMQTDNRQQMLETYERVEKLALREVQADVDNYWAYADLIVSRLALGRIKEAEAVLENTLYAAPVDSPYTLESLLDTLQRLNRVLEPAQRAAVERVMAHIRHFKAQRQQQLRVEL
jgi:tetratricopeptide (TPR) repeat protein